MLEEFVTFLHCVITMSTETNKDELVLGIPSGTRDFHPAQVKIREEMFATIRSIFERHGAVSIETPVFEHRSILMGKYGEDEKLIYELDDQGSGKLALRYDHTVPLARYVAQYGVTNLVRYVIGKVYRRDTASISRGRYREFYQCDIDFVGDYGSLKPDAECLKIFSDILTALSIGTFEIKVNHRALLDGIFEHSGVPADKFRAISSAVDKLDKVPWVEVRAEMVEKKGLDPEVADKIGLWIALSLNKGSEKKTPLVLLKELMSSDLYQHNHQAKTGLHALEFIFNLVHSAWPDAYANLTLDLSLARGLDYYSGSIFEAVVTTPEGSVENPAGAIGSVGGGGRYDHLIGMFHGSDIPAVGFAVGVERIFAIKQRMAQVEDKPSYSRGHADVYVANVGVDDTTVLRIIDHLWKRGISATYSYRSKQSVKKQFADAEDLSARYTVVLGADELANGTVGIKNMKTKEQSILSIETWLPQLEEMLRKSP